MNRSVFTFDRKSLVLGPAAALLAASGCLAEEGTPEGDPAGEVATSEAQSALASEYTINANQRIVYAAGLYYSQPDVAFNQYAEASFSNGCNGVMIGPSVFFTAAHCGGGTVTLTFRTYRTAHSAFSDTEAFTCQSMSQTFIDTDSALYHCLPNAAGQKPGDKYGYVDFDVTPPVNGQQIYSISANLQGTPGVAHDQRMYANGQVTNNAGIGHWFAPTGAPNTGVEMNLWGEGGMSGSPHFSAATHRMIIAPLSTAGGWSRNALSMRDLLYWGYHDPAYDPNAQGPTVDTAVVSSLGLTPATYYGWADKNLDWEFDLQYDLERLRGESRRDWYYLGFESQRRNALWDPTANTSIDLANRWARINRTSGTGFTDALWHHRLNLQAGTYRITFMTNTQASQYSGSLWVGLRAGAAFYAGEYVGNTVGSGWQMHTVEVTASVDNLSVAFGLNGTADILLSAVSIVKINASMDFDTSDKRWNWRNDIDGSRAVVVPDGRTTGTPNWAVRVAPPATVGYPVRNRQLALAAGRTYQICFDARRETAGGTAQLQLRVVSGGTQVVTSTVTPGSAWGTYCTGTFTPGSDDNNLQIRLASGDAPFLVDNLTIWQ